MATNKFANVLHKNTHKITLVLIYSILEWILILLLLLNGLFSYLISKFASFFGLTPPCIFCSRVDHLFEPNSSLASHRHHLCDSHKIEVSQLGFCSVHTKLAEAGDMCEDCGTSRPAPGGGGAVLSWMRRSEMGEKDLKCSCCGIALESGFYSPYFVLKPNWGVLEYTHKGDLDKDANFEVEEGKLVSFDVFNKVDERERELKATLERENEREREENHEGCISEKDAVFDVDFERNLIPNPEEEPLIVTLNDSTPIVPNDCFDNITARNLEPEFENPRIFPLEMIDSMTITMPVTKTCDSNCNIGDETGQNESDNGLTGRDLNPFDIGVVLEEEKKMVSIVQQSSNSFEEENKTEDLNISIGSEIPDQEENFVSPNIDREIIMEPDDTLVNLIDLSSPLHDESIHVIGPIEIERVDPIESLNDSIEQNISEDEKPPETPTHSTRLQTLDFEAEPLTIDDLKSALESKRIALRTIYSELEEERISSAISANESMAMINRLQEEKAAMQMEALQYQRMMEEQSEYDQEALHLLNELVGKREREKQEVERELEGYKRKVRVYERKIMRFSEGSNGNKSGLDNSSSFSSDCSLDGNDENALEVESELVPMGSIEETLDEFEEERISILEQLKGLEEKLFELDQEGENCERFEQNGNNNHHEDYESDVLHISSSNGSVKHGSRCKGKKLLPLFDEVSFDNGDNNYNNNNINNDDNNDEECVRRERFAIEEEIGEVYERVQALEADREFLRHCIKSLKKGDAGLALLKEILQHLRDLKRVELRVKNSNDGFGSFTV